jgi:hypothetical protein
VKRKCATTQGGSHKGQQRLRSEGAEKKEKGKEVLEKRPWDDDKDQAEGETWEDWMTRWWMSAECEFKALRREVAALRQENMEIWTENSKQFMWTGRTLVEIKQRLIEMEKAPRSRSNESSSEEEEEKAAENGNEGVGTGRKVEARKQIQWM